MRKFKTGDALNIPARDYNAMVDAAEAHKAGKMAAGRTPKQRSETPCTILVKNTTDANVPRFGVLTLSAPVIEPGTSAGQNTSEFQRRVVMTGVAPSEGDDNYVITTESIAAGKIGKAMAIGVTPVSIYVEPSTVDYLYAAAKDADSDKMQMAESGMARILWREDGVGIKLAIVRLTGGSSDSALLWARAKGNWKNYSGNSSYVECNPCPNSSGSTYDSEIDLNIYLPRTPGCDPNVVAGQVIGYQASADGSYVAVTGYLDAAIGTIRMWAPNDTDPPAGWTECIPGGTSGRATPIVQRLDGRFPIGRDTDEEDFDTTGEYSTSSSTTSHSHQIARDMADPDWQHSIYIDEGTANTTLFTVMEADSELPYCVVRFIERYDNSSS